MQYFNITHHGIFIANQKYYFLLSNVAKTKSKHKFLAQAGGARVFIKVFFLQYFSIKVHYNFISDRNGTECLLEKVI